MCEEERIAPGRGGPRDDAVRACRDLLRGLAARHDAGPDRPAWVGLLDLASGHPLVSAVIPLRNIGLRLRHVPESREPAGVARAAQRARQDEGERAAGEDRPERGRLPLALRRKADPCARCAAPRGSTPSRRGARSRAVAVPRPAALLPRRRCNFAAGVRHDVGSSGRRLRGRLRPSELTSYLSVRRSGCQSARATAATTRRTRPPRAGTRAE